MSALFVNLMPFDLNVYTMYNYSVHYPRYMRLRINKWGNSLGLRLPKFILDQLHCSEGDELELTVENGQLVLSKPHADLDLLLASVQKDQLHAETDTGSVMGNEIW